MMRPLDEKTMAANRQVAPEDLPAIAAAGITLVVNNRPDGEEAGQPLSAEIEAAARAAGLDYRHIPIAGGFNMDDVLAMADALDATEGKVLAFCRTGTRSTFLWALARSERGEAADRIVAAAAAAGYDLAPIRAYLN
ncbi:MAG TPA: TIGR01244 family sulfur transferase [Allosphingosinicella sp.]|nr:TIGR01244 family sulfur transferase [Allosphingosinicella sp.]